MSENSLYERCVDAVFLTDSSKTTLSAEIITFEVNIFCWYIFIWYKFRVVHMFNKILSTSTIQIYRKAWKTSMGNCLSKELYIDALEIIQFVYKTLLPKEELGNVVLIWLAIPYFLGSKEPIWLREIDRGYFIGLKVGQ